MVSNGPRIRYISLHCHFQILLAIKQFCGGRNRRKSFAALMSNNAKNLVIGINSLLLTDQDQDALARVPLLLLPIQFWWAELPPGIVSWPRKNVCSSKKLATPLLVSHWGRTPGVFCYRRQTVSQRELTAPKWIEVISNREKLWGGAQGGSPTAASPAPIKSPFIQQQRLSTTKPWEK